jgi:hypothetical protein
MLLHTGGSILAALTISVCAVARGEGASMSASGPPFRRAELRSPCGKH